MTTLTRTDTAPGDAPVGDQRLLAAARRSAADQRAASGPVPHPGLDELVGLLHDAGLTGRGGGGFPSGRKLRAVADARGRASVVVNAMEGEPLSHKDAVLLSHAPDLVLDGLDVLSHALGTRHRVVAVGPDIDPAALTAAAGLRSPVRIERLAGGFVAGQETALIRQLAGGPPLPADPSVRVTERGLRGRPTLVLNAETAAHVGLLARHGAAWFRSAGLAEDPGTFLATITGSGASTVGRPGVVEAARGVLLRDLLDRAGARRDRVQAVLVGGYHGAWVPASAVASTRMTRADLVSWDAAVGAGVVHVLDVEACPLQAAAEVAAYLADHSARQCGPCRHGMPAVAYVLHDLARPGARVDLDALDRLMGLTSGRGACAHPDGSMRFVGSTLRVFAHHVDAHRQGACHGTVAR